MSRELSEIPNQKPEWQKVLEEEGLFKYHEYLVMGARIETKNDKPTITSVSLLKEDK